MISSSRPVSFKMPMMTLWGGRSSKGLPFQLTLSVVLLKIRPENWACMRRTAVISAFFNACPSSSIFFLAFRYSALSSDSSSVDLSVRNRGTPMSLPIEAMS
jgi:hypothetical protein